MYIPNLTSKLKLKKRKKKRIYYLLDIVNEDQLSMIYKKVYCNIYVNCIYIIKRMIDRHRHIDV